MKSVIKTTAIARVKILAQESNLTAVEQGQLELILNAMMDKHGISQDQLDYQSLLIHVGDAS